MSSRRYPGKVLAPFLGKPLISHTISVIRSLLPEDQIVLLTSEHLSDDPLCCYAATLVPHVFRGSLNNVFDRFLNCAQEYPCDWILRLSGDSPLLDRTILEEVLTHVGSVDYDLITTTFPRSFPRGRNAELIRTDALLRANRAELTAEDQEHVTPYFYRNPADFRVLNISSGHPEWDKVSLAVDTLDDLKRLETMTAEDLKQYAYCKD